MRRRNRFLAFILTAAMVFALVPSVALTITMGAASFAGGTGTVADPWQIVTVEQLEMVNNDLFAHYILMNDINAPLNFMIGTAAQPFNGTFDGGGNTITGNFFMWGALAEVFGLFRVIGTSGVVRNLTVDGHSSGGVATDAVGGLVGINNGTVLNVSTIGGFSSTSGTGSRGGLVGINNGTVTNSSAMGSVSGASGSDGVGGLVGINNGTITNSVALNTNLSGSNFVGRIWGRGNGSGSGNHARASMLVSGVIIDSTHSDFTEATLTGRHGECMSFYTVTFDLDGGELMSGELVQQVPNGDNATPPTVERDGYTFDGWDGDYTNVTSDRTITAQWDYTPNGGELKLADIVAWDGVNETFSVAEGFDGVVLYAVIRMSPDATGEARANAFVRARWFPLVGDFNVSRLIPRRDNRTAVIAFRTLDDVTVASPITVEGNSHVVAISGRADAPRRGNAGFATWDNGIVIQGNDNPTWANFDVMVGRAGVNGWDNLENMTLTQAMFPMGGSMMVRHAENRAITTSATGTTIIPAGNAMRVRVPVIARAPNVPAANRNLNQAWEYRIVNRDDKANVCFAEVDLAAPDNNWNPIVGNRTLTDLRHGRADGYYILLRVAADTGRNRPASHIAVVSVATN